MFGLSNRGTDSWKRHGLHMQLGLLMSLLMLVAAVHVQRTTTPEVAPDVTPQETIAVDEVQPTTQTKTPPPPSRPLVPVEVPDNQIIDGDPIEINSTELEIEQERQTQLGLSGRPEEGGDSQSDPFVSVEDSPDCGGVQALHGEVRYPEYARKVGIEGRVRVRFVVTKEGNVVQPEILQGAHELLNDEALRAVDQLKCTPGRQRGKPVAVRMTLPVIFQLGSSR